MLVIQRPKDKFSSESHNVVFGSVPPKIKGLKHRRLNAFWTVRLLHIIRAKTETD